MKPIKKTVATLAVAAIVLTAAPLVAYAYNENGNNAYIHHDYNVYGHGGFVGNSDNTDLAFASANSFVDAETVKENYLAAMEAEKDYVKRLLDNGAITQEQYDLITANIQATIDYVNENGLSNYYGFGSHGGHYGVYGGHHGYNSAIDPETAKENYLAAMEAEKNYAKTMLDNGIITQERYDLIIANIQAAINYVNENGLTNNYGGFGGHHW